MIRIQSGCRIVFCKTMCFLELQKYAEKIKKKKQTLCYFFCIFVWSNRCKFLYVHIYLFL